MSPISPGGNTPLPPPPKVVQFLSSQKVSTQPRPRHACSPTSAAAGTWHAPGGRHRARSRTASADGAPPALEGDRGGGAAPVVGASARPARGATRWDPMRGGGHAHHHHPPPHHPCQPPRGRGGWVGGGPRFLLPAPPPPPGCNTALPPRWCVSMVGVATASDAAAAAVAAAASSPGHSRRRTQVKGGGGGWPHRRTVLG